MGVLTTVVMALVAMTCRLVWKGGTCLGEGKVVSVVEEKTGDLVLGGRVEEMVKGGWWVVGLRVEQLTGVVDEHVTTLLASDTTPYK